jgi:hypothetical protein
MLRTGAADHQVVIRSHVLFDSNCVSLEPPVIDLDAPPGRGVLCQRRVDDIVINVLQPGSPLRCLGKKTSGVLVVYLPRHGYTGADTVRYIVHFPGRSPVTYTANLVIVPDTPPSSGAVPADISAPADDAPQSPGRLPLCPALVS